MAAHTLHRPDPGHSLWLDWFLILAGALFAWLCWPGMHQ
jgi:hypothetical protein